MAPVDSGMEEEDGETGLPSVEEEGWLPVPGIVIVVLKVTVPVLVMRLVIVEVLLDVDVELEREEGSIGEPSVEEVLPPVGEVTVGSLIV